MKWKKWVNKCLSYAGVKLVRREPERAAQTSNLYPLDDGDPADIEINKLKNLTAYTKASGSPYDAREFPNGYQTLRIAGLELKGQRDASQRFQDVPFEFSGATVLDLGCNQGGMLFAIADRIKSGIGVDYDYRMVNAATRIRSFAAIDNLDFYVFDLDHENLHLLRNFLPGSTVDIVFLLAVCQWLKNWKSVIDMARSVSPAMLFETNGPADMQDNQEAYLRTIYADVSLVRSASTDDLSEQRRKLFLCKA
jgi:SAM-dependent methyltransferase